jgi:uncharacterized protein (TIRG00374 family)
VLHLRNRKAKAVLKLVLSGLLLFWLFRSVHLSKIVFAVSDVNGALLVLAVLCQAASNLIAGLRWCLTMKLLDIEEPPVFFVKSFFKGTFFNQVLPGSIGGDGIRMLDLKARSYGVSDAVEGVIIDRGIGLLCLLAVCLLASFPAGHILPAAVLRWVRYICVFGICGFGAFALLSRVQVFRKIRCLSFVTRTSEKTWRVFSAGSKTGIIIALSMVVHIFAVFSIYLISLSTGQALGFLLFLAVFPAAVLLTVVPVSFAGWGVREGALVALFMGAGVGKDPVLLISLLYGFGVIIASMPGLFFWLQKRKAVKGVGAVTVPSIDHPERPGSGTLGVRRLKYE